MNDSVKEIIVDILWVKLTTIFLLCYFTNTLLDIAFLTLSDTEGCLRIFFPLTESLANASKLELHTE